MACDLQLLEHAEHGSTAVKQCTAVAPEQHKVACNRPKQVAGDLYQL